MQWLVNFQRLVEAILVMETDREVMKGNTSVLFLDNESAICVGLNRAMEVQLDESLTIDYNVPSVGNAEKAYQRFHK